MFNYFLYKIKKYFFQILIFFFIILLLDMYDSLHRYTYSMYVLQIKGCENLFFLIDLYRYYLCKMFFYMFWLLKKYFMCPPLIAELLQYLIKKAIYINNDTDYGFEYAFNAIYATLILALLLNLMLWQELQDKQFKEIIKNIIILNFVLVVTILYFMST